jgi:hypothetical protein
VTNHPNRSRHAPTLPKVKVSASKMADMLVAAEFGYKQCEKGANLSAALGALMAMFEPESGADEVPS